ncbi:MAG: hypothetical protein IJM32_05925 [Ruminococcus sp.]|nr:hypothetical protein [Ruminococcus sp.]
MQVLIKIIVSVLMLYYIYCTYVSFRALLNKRLRKRIRAACFLRILSAAVLLAGLGIYVFVHIKAEVVSYSYHNGVIVPHSSYGKYDSVLFAVFAAAAVLMLASIPFDSLLHKQTSAKVRNIAVSLILTVATVTVGIIIVALNYHGDLSDHDAAFYRYDSPDKSTSIVICERDHAGIGYGDIYQIKNQKAKKLGTFKTDSGLRNDGKYKLEWSKEQIKVTYLFKPDHYKTVAGKFVKL